MCTLERCSVFFFFFLVTTFRRKRKAERPIKRNIRTLRIPGNVLRFGKSVKLIFQDIFLSGYLLLYSSANKTKKLNKKGTKLFYLFLFILPVHFRFFYFENVINNEMIRKVFVCSQSGFII